VHEKEMRKSLYFAEISMSLPMEIERNDKYRPLHVNLLRLPN
jgi:hypothetical protein